MECRCSHIPGPASVRAITDDELCRSDCRPCEAGCHTSVDPFMSNLPLQRLLMHPDFYECASGY